MTPVCRQDTTYPRVKAITLKIADLAPCGFAIHRGYQDDGVTILKACFPTLPGIPGFELRDLQTDPICLPGCGWTDANVHE
jgi:hypothetical protein